MKLILSLLLSLTPPVTAQEIRDTRWQSGAGEWTDAAHWTQGVPDAWSRVSMSGVLDARLTSPQPVAVGGLRFGSNPGDRARLVIDGAGFVARRDFISAGGHDGSEAEIIIENGALHGVSAFYLGGSGERTLARTKARLELRGGSLLHRIITLGWGQDADAVLHIRGSRVEAAHVLDYLTMGVPGADLVPSTSTLAFTLDERGVTPVTIQSRRAGFSISRKSPNRCRLAVMLSAVPPRDEVTLIAAQVPTKGAFDDLPEGAEVRARHDGRDYAWTLTYRGGQSGCDVLLTKVRGHAENARVTSCRPRPAIPVPLWETMPPEAIVRATDAAPAFPDAEGFGRNARGGRDGLVIWVENLHDDGPGSFRAAMMTRGPRRIAFRVAGEIALKSVMRVSEPFVTVDGSTAPAGGITFTGDGFMVTTHDVVLRHFRIRPGDDAVDTDALSFSDARRCIADHLSLSWGTDEVCSITGLSDEITVQWCVISEGLNRENHGYAGVLGGERVTWHHNLMAHHVSRVPRFAGIVRADFRNNVLYNWGHTAGYGQFERVNYVANYLKPGPSTTQKPPLIHAGVDVVGNGTLFLEGNGMQGGDAVTGFAPDVIATKPFEAPPVRTASAQTAFEQVLARSGALPDRRDATDTRIIRETRDGTGSIVKRSGDWQSKPSGP